MPPARDDTHTHCVVRWENSNEYAVVHLERVKTAVSTLKPGIVIAFEGYQRVRRRGEILFLDCFAFGFESVEDDSQLSTYGWGDPPGLREQAEGLVQTIQGGISSSLQRTASSSSTASSINLPPKSKRKKLANVQPNDQPTALDESSMPPPSTSSTSLVSRAADNTNAAVVNRQSSSDSPAPSSAIQTDSNGTSSTDINSLLKEISALKQEISTLKQENDALKEENLSVRKKVMDLEEQLVYQQETSVPLPSEETYNYYKSVTALYEKTKNSYHSKAIDLAKKLPCTSMELKLAKKCNEAQTINKLVEYCFKNIKDVDLKTMPYSVIYDMYPELLNNIYEYVQYIHAPLVITKSRFSGAISLKSRHARSGEKRKGPSSASSGKTKSTKKAKVHDENQARKSRQNSREGNDLSVDEINSDKENIDDVF